MDILLCGFIGTVVWAAAWGIALFVYEGDNEENGIRLASRCLLFIPIWPLIILFLLGKAIWSIPSLSWKAIAWLARRAELEKLAPASVVKLISSPEVGAGQLSEPDGEGGELSET